MAAGLMALASLASFSNGCALSSSTRLWADTALPDGAMSTAGRQWAYDGEPVTFELECEAGAANYVVFGVGGDETVVSAPKVEGRYRWTHTFHAGPKPQTFEVYAAPYLIRGKCDWVYDQNEDKWYHYPGGSESPDVQTGPERTMKITCYRAEVRLKFKAPGGPPRRVALALVTADGRRTEIPERPLAGADARGFLLLRSGAGDTCEVVYTPLYSEVSRAGKTQAELLIERADGSTVRLQQEFDTP
jgi:hypothetical protein